ncbi:unnamed protein product [Medioppia subpectinata]|uniref:ABC-2 type transporter transmembrane domain-containing protein n=1 Tax=Medioppia subpectinata TaxID=1979941 RepID=A0A7R9QAV7_9ACAR|nr:unnamed protein product [Medioppia subpectinata]CAG2116990.1 unnamed protein product [Medioppia subpectinata]
MLALALLLGALPFVMIIGVMFNTIVYFMAGLNPDLRTYGISIGLCFLMIMCGCFVGCFISVISPNSEMAMLIFTPTLMTMMLFSGLFINVGN